MHAYFKLPKIISFSFGLFALSFLILLSDNLKADQSLTAPLSSLCKKNNLTGKWVQKQYEVDLNAAKIWVFSLYLDCDSGTFVQTQGSAKIEVINQIQNEVSKIEETLDSGYAFDDGKFYVYNSLASGWVLDRRDPTRELQGITDSFSYFSVKDCPDWNFEIQNLQSQLKAEKAVSDSKIKTDNLSLLAAKIDEFQDQSKMNLTFNRDKWEISVIRNKAGQILDWQVSEAGIVVRRIVNEKLPSDFLLPKVTDPVKFSGPKLGVVGDELLGKKGLGFFLSPNNKGEIVIYYLMKGAPASIAGFMENDIIKSINAIPVDGLPISDVSKILAGGESFSIVILRGASREEKVIAVKKSLIE